ncbi:MAG: twin-arginine translocase subunit TatC [candidate division WOR-3 bacterium]
MKKEFALLDHLEALRWALVRSIIVLILAASASYVFGERIIRFIASPTLPSFILNLPYGERLSRFLVSPVGQLYFFTPQEAFWVRLKVAFVTGLVLAAPYILGEAWAFIAPGLRLREKAWALPFLVFSIIMFYIGCALAMWFAIPVGIRFLSSFGGSAMSPFFGASGYVNFVIFMTLAFGLLFETPVLMVALTGMGVLDPKAVAKKRAYVIILAFIVAAVVTPTVDFVTQIFLAVPLILLFELGLLLSRLVKRTKRE